MADLYRYPVFFECLCLGEEQRRKIEKYFLIRRKSSGGECGPVRGVKEHTYSVAFRYEKDQQAVLQRYKHVVNELVFTVRGSLEPHASSPSQDFPAPAQQSPQSIPASSPPPSGEEYELRLDPYLLRYLKECPRAEEELEEELASVACSAQLYPEEERVVVSWLAQPGATQDVRNWKAVVDRIFDGYLYHYEVEDPRRVKALLQSCGSHQTTDEVKVYSEGAMAVVVGKRPQVNARLKDLEDRPGLSEMLLQGISPVNSAPSDLGSQRRATAGAHGGGVHVEIVQGTIETQQQSPQSIPASSPLPSGEEYELRLDPYLLRYLKECPRAEEELEEELASVACSAQLYPEEERVVVSWLAQPGATQDVRNWKAVVDRIFDGYLCHYEVEDPRRVKALLQSCGSHRTTDEVKVYSEGGMVVVVGKRPQVNARLKDLEDRPGLSERLLQGISPVNSAPSDLGSQRKATDGAHGGGVHVEIVQGTIETQQVDAVASPMLGDEPLSTRVGHSLFATVGPQLTANFRQEAGDETLPGDTVLVELPSSAVFFLSLIPWDDDPEGTAVQVLRLAINNILTSCEDRGFGSVALPVLGAGIALGFPDSVVASVLLDQVCVFEQNRASGTPFLVRIVIHPDDEEASEAFKSIWDNFQLTKDVPQPDQVSVTRRIVLLGKTGSGKSNLANTIFGEELFTMNHSPNSGTSECKAVTRSVNGRSITLIDTPGFFDVNRPEEELKPEIVRCITECSPGPHAFLIVLKVEKFTEHEQAVISKIRQYFTKDALKYAVIVFTHGDQLPRGMTIQEFVRQNENLSDLVKECGGRCHVMDNKYWKNKQQNNYRSNQSQVEELLSTLDEMVMQHNGGYYTNEVFQEVEKVIQIEEERIKQNMSSGDMQPDEIRQQAKSTVSQVFMKQAVGTATGALLGAVFGVAMSVGLVLSALRNCVEFIKLLKTVSASGGAAAAGAAAGGGVEVAGLVVGVTTVLAVTGGALGGVIGCEAAGEAETPWEAAQMAANAVMTKGKAALKRL